MSTNEPMTDERLAEARVALDEDMSQWSGEYGLDLLAEVERLRALTTVDDDMVNRAARAMCDIEAQPDQVMWDKLDEDERDSWRIDARAALEAALNSGEGS